MNAQSHADRIAHTMMEPTKAQAQRREFAALAPKKARKTSKENAVHPFDRVDVELLRARHVVATGGYRVM